MSVSATPATANKEREVSSTRTPATIRLLLADGDDAEAWTRQLDLSWHGMVRARPPRTTCRSRRMDGEIFSHGGVELRRPYQRRGEVSRSKRRSGGGSRM